MMANRRSKRCRSVVLALVIGLTGLTAYTTKAQPLASHTDLNGMTLQGTNANGAHCEIAFRHPYSGPTSGFTFTSAKQRVMGEMWWHYKNLLCVNFGEYGFRGRIFPRKVVMEDVTPITASINLHTIFGEAYRSPSEGSGYPDAGSVDCDGQTIRIDIWIEGSVESAQAQLAIMRRFEAQDMHSDLKVLPDGLGENGYVLPSNRADCLSSFVFNRGNVLISMPTNCFRARPDCDDAILKAARLLDTAITQEQNGVTVIRMPKVLFLRH